MSKGDLAAGQSAPPVPRETLKALEIVRERNLAKCGRRVESRLNEQTGARLRPLMQLVQALAPGNRLAESTARGQNLLISTWRVAGVWRVAAALFWWSSSSLLLLL